jgi:hypothetical protein
MEQVNLTILRSDWTEPPGTFTVTGLTAEARTLLGCPNTDT